MMVTHADINNDLHMLMNNMEGTEKPLVNPKEAIKKCMVWPLSCALCYAFSMFWIAYNFKPYIGNFNHEITVLKEYGFVFVFGAFSILFAFFVAFALYGPVLAYLSLSKDVRDKSIIISRLKRLSVKLARFFFLCNFALAAIASWIPELLVAAPFVFLFSFLIMQGFVSAEATRYGMAPVLNKIKKLASKL